MRESDFLRLLKQRLSGLPSAPEIELGVGDDAAILRLHRDPRFVVTTDMLLDGVDFEIASCGYRSAGRKAMHKNLSDIAAMGARPIAAFVSVALPHGCREEDAAELLDGLCTAAERFHCPIAGGDTKRSPSGLVVNVAIAGCATGKDFVRRSGARPGDALWVSGRLGGSVLGHHATFEPRLDLARALASRDAVSAMIDLSDGLSTDLGHLAEASSVGFELDAARIPLSAAAHALAAQDGTSALDHALCDGEDYELLFTVRDPVVFEAVRVAHPEFDLSRIGAILPRASGRSLVRVDALGNTTREALAARGFEHRFESPRKGE